MLDVRMHRLALNRPRPHERHLHREIVDRLGPRAQQALHLRAALDLEGADRVRPLDLREHVDVIEWNPGEIDRRAVCLGDLLHALLDGREHAETEQVDLEKAGIGTRVLVPLAHLAPGHRGGLHGHEVDQRSRRDHHAARMLRDMTRQAGDLCRKELECTPASGHELPVGVGKRGNLSCDAGGIPAVGHPCEPLELGLRQTERLADVADRATRAVGGEARNESGVLVPVSLGHRDDQLLPDVTGEVEVDVGDGGELVVEKAAEREIVRDRIDVREPRQIADDRADRAAATTTGRQEAAG